MWKIPQNKPIHSIGAKSLCFEWLTNLLFAIKKCDREADFKFFVQRCNSDRFKVYADTAVSIFSKLQSYVQFKHLPKFTLASIEFHFTKVYSPPKLNSTNLVYLFCVHRKVEDVNVNIIYTFQPNLFSVLSE